MKSVMTHQFSQVPTAEIQRSSFDRSHGVKTTFDAGYLVPIYLDEALPGDTFNVRMAAFARLATPLKPIMDNMFMETFFFAVPYRLVWNNWERFNGAQDNPDDSTDYTVPLITMPNAGAGGVPVGSLFDYFGIPTGVGTAGFSINALFSRAYNLVWNQWFRDQNLQDSVVVDKDDGPDTYADYNLLRRGKRHDYFTSCLPWPQKGPDVLLPIGGTAPIDGTGVVETYPGANPSLAFNQDISATGATPTNPWLESPGIGGYTGALTGSVSVPSANTNLSDIAAGLTADLSAATAATINAIREAFQLQRIYERDARGGTRYIEILEAHFRVKSPDARLQRPEYLGGGSSPVNVHPVAQTGAAVTDSPQGNLAAFGTASFNGHGFTKSFTEHCILIGLVCVRADLTYQQGINKMFARSTRFDFYWPALSHLGEQAVLNYEIFAKGTVNDQDVFGYQERFAEYRYKPSLITGQFRSTFAQSLDVWHLSQEFSDYPTLSPEFIVEDPPIDRCIAVPSEPHFLFDGYFSMKCARPMPVYGVPGLMDHF